MLAGTAPAYAAGTSQQVWLTFYGWYDNTPPGCATASGGCAGGTGTYSDPITFATDKSEAPTGTIIWVPRVGKYFVMADDCTECDQDWSGQGPDGGPKMWHFGLWLGGQGCSDGQKVSAIGGGGKGTVTFTGISEPSAGRYTMTVYYLSVGKARPAVITVNGTAQTVTFAESSSGSYSVIDTATVKVSLKAGSSNTIEFSGSGTTGAPDLDHIVV
ncbi:MAG TPA: hypothetical protein VGX23_26815 [Actinocrinis sp.]|nr:hypothetical protein [Actinocrinis sp.]